MGKQFLPVCRHVHVHAPSSSLHHPCTRGLDSDIPTVFTDSQGELGRESGALRKEDVRLARLPKGCATMHTRIGKLLLVGATELVLATALFGQTFGQITGLIT